MLKMIPPFANVMELLFAAKINIPEACFHLTGNSNEADCQRLKDYFVNYCKSRPISDSWSEND
jgi:hypothetical protein